MMHRRLIATNANAAPSAIRLTKSAGATNAPSTSGTTECPIKFVCVPRPFWDFRLEYKGKSDDDDDDENADGPREKAWNETLEEARKTWLKPAAEFPGYTWTVCWFYRYASHVILNLKRTAVLKRAKVEQEIRSTDSEEGPRRVWNVYLQRLYRVRTAGSYSEPVVCVQQ